MMRGSPTVSEYLFDMASTPKKRVAIYARVSTLDKGQDPETQLRQLREYVQRRGFDVAGEYVDYATGTNEDRANYQRLLDDVRKRKVDVVLVWRYDRFARSTQALINGVSIRLAMLDPPCSILKPPPTPPTSHTSIAQLCYRIWYYS